MKEFNRKYSYQLTTLAPLHIGTGEAMTPLEYLIGEDLFVPELDRVFAKYPAAAERFARKLAGASAEKLARVGLDQLIDKQAVSDPEVCRYKVAPFIFKEKVFVCADAANKTKLVDKGAQWEYSEVKMVLLRARHQHLDVWFKVRAF